MANRRRAQPSVLPSTAAITRPNSAELTLTFAVIRRRHRAVMPASRLATGNLADSTPLLFDFPFVDSYDVLDSSFFRAGKVLPSPDAVRVRANGDNKGRGDLLLRPPVQRYRGLNLIVKYGHHVSIAEAHCLMFLRTHAPAVPVPELFAWRRDKRQTFLYMEFISGHRACDVQLDTRIYQQIDAVLDVLKAIPQSLVSPVPFVGHVNATQLRDWFILNSTTPPHEAGPFSSVAAFHDWLIYEHAGSAPCPEMRDKYRADLLDDDPIVLTHGGLTLDNLIVSDYLQPNGTVAILGVVDWSQAGWYPAYWAKLKSDYDDGQDEPEDVTDCLEACDFCIISAST